MKKFTLLFATLLAMFGDAFGQKEGKVLWEKKIDELDTKNMDTFFYRTSIFASPNGNLLLSSEETPPRRFMKPTNQELIK
ncbi:hypothetical protein VB796_14120 [Arcicella sp. LKC2W]|uniref:hypothetical protein n=1 Tax=Arcicella sp. LKC2W TaxID=2984198 RepID=UPI002B209D08|nr:hypothetical protein [Arcicella sp. LKC2W]MEA5460189.1 hypothetical protein [Arcicella sp. LKC2W]